MAKAKTKSSHTTQEPSATQAPRAPGKALKSASEAPALRCSTEGEYPGNQPYAQDGRIESIQLMLHFMDREGERYWQRNAVFVSIITALFGLFIIKLSEFGPIQFLFLGMFGVIASRAWVEVLDISKFYAERWRQDACAYVKSHSDLASVFHTVCGEPLIERPSGPGSSAVMKRLARLSQVTWFAVIAYGVLMGVVPICGWQDLVPWLAKLCS
jgi:hypothetical protein